MTARDVVWQDATTYSRGERGKVEAQTWIYKQGPLEIIVTRHIGCEGTWFMRCDALRIGTTDLREGALVHAQALAIKRVRERLAALQKALP